MEKDDGYQNVGVRTEGQRVIFFLAKNDKCYYS